jgi:hypothetical protein
MEYCLFVLLNQFIIHDIIINFSNIFRMEFCFDRSFLSKCQKDLASMLSPQTEYQLKINNQFFVTEVQDLPTTNIQ